MKGNSPLESLYDRPGFLLKRCHQLSVGIFVERCSEFKLTPSQYGALCALHAYPGIDQIALGRLIGLDRSTVGLVIRLLDERNLLDRQVNAKDKRRMRLRLSPAGLRLLADVAPAAEQAQQDVLAVLPKPKHVLFLELLHEFLDGHGAVIVPDEIVGTSGSPADQARESNQTAPPDSSPFPCTASKRRGNTGKAAKGNIPVKRSRA